MNLLSPCDLDDVPANKGAAKEMNASCACECYGFLGIWLKIVALIPRTHQNRGILLIPRYSTVPQGKGKNTDV